MLKKSLFLFLLLISVDLKAQDPNLLLALTIPSELRENANAIVRLNDIQIDISSYNKMFYKKTRIVTVLNSSGNYYIGSSVSYDNNVNIKKLEAKIYDAFGKEIKKFKKNDFTDISAVSGSTLYSDSRVKYLDYTPINYPYTVVISSEVEYRSTAFIPGWYPIEGFYVSTENSKYQITNSTSIELKSKELNFEGYELNKISKLNYTANNLKAIRTEAYSVAIENIIPILKVALTEFDMEGVKGVNTNWKDFGLWMNDELIQGTQELPLQTKEHIKSLTVNANSDIEKAKIVYKYVQDKTRYISVQVGIGGWKPMLASDVDKLGYGDCKGLTNYTKALLQEVGVESYYTVIHGDRNITHIDNEFSSVQGNHVILSIPQNDDFIWLECTSQSAPFGYIANFTDNRNALVITPEGGKIVKTKAYDTEENLLKTNASIRLNADGGIDASVLSKSFGTQYSFKEGIQSMNTKDQLLHYKDYWGYINNLNIKKLNIENNKDSIVFNEVIDIKADRYASKAGNRLLFQPNVFNRITKTPARYDNRLHDFEIQRGFTDVDEYKIQLEDNIQIESSVESKFIESEFGEYSFSLEVVDEKTLIYKRKYILKNGKYPKESYESFRNFINEVIKLDNSKIALTNNL